MQSCTKDPTLTKAMALALMRQALALLDTIGEAAPARPLRLAIDTLSGKSEGGRPDGRGS